MLRELEIRPRSCSADGPNGCIRAVWRAQKIRGFLWTALFFGSLAGVLAFLIWLANRYPASRPTHRRNLPGKQVRMTVRERFTTGYRIGFGAVRRAQSRAVVAMVLAARVASRWGRGAGRGHVARADASR